MTTETQADLLQRSEQLYAEYVRPLEREHFGEYVAVASTGKLVIAPTLLEAMERAEKTLPPGSFLFKVGDIAIDMWR